MADDIEERLHRVAVHVGTRYSAWYGIGARDVEEVLRQAARVGLVTLNFDNERAEPMTGDGPVCNLNKPWEVPR